jgi:enoyl-CoA hydratase
MTGIRVERDGRIGILTLDRPRKLNALTGEMITDLLAGLAQLGADPLVSVILLRGEGRAFSAGFDLSEPYEAGLSPAEQIRRMWERDFDCIMAFWDCPKPVVAAVQGYCLGGAFELALACDVTIAAEEALFGEPETKIGSSIVAMLLPWVTGAKAAHEILLTGMDRLPAARALALGIVNRVVPGAELDSAARAFAAEFAAASPQSVAATRRALKRTYDRMGFRDSLREGLEIALAYEADPGPDQPIFETIRAKDGLAAALAWRNDPARVT